MEKAKDDYFAEWCKEYINDATESYEFSLWMLDFVQVAPEYSPRHAMDSNHRHFDRRRPRPSESAPAELNHRRVTPGAVPNGTVPPGATRSPSPASSHANNYSQRTLDALLSASERESQPHLHPRKLNGALWFGIDPSVYKFVRTTWQSNFVGPWKNWSDVPKDRQ
ncbi:hypothetical protein AXX17_AT3G35410 [Arabidopsis thaliana]|uniref:Uncharacterized protein n=1 Tax=Arabidopsis thaliana TaxID=3702 RepID=A0A178VGM5_ARATH|nr:hypothetical protein AXX17_AT3G35410 [Arabidopsis thaliana]